MLDDGPVQPLMLLHDEPIESPEHDCLGLSRFARIVAAAALGNSGPLSIGVYGGWGQGKTSLLNLARRLIATTPHFEHVVTVHFDAWLYEHEPHPIVPLLATIEKEVTRRLVAETMLVRKVGKAGLSWMKSISANAVTFLSAFSGKVTGKLSIPFIADGSLELGIEPEKAIEAGAALEHMHLNTEVTDWQRLRDECLSWSVFEHLDQIGAAVFTGTSADLTKTPRIVVFVDDLDRCQPSKAFSLLEQIKTVLSRKGFVFVLALNREVIETFLSQEAARRYGDKQEHVQHGYLDKLIQLPIHIPPHQANLAVFIKSVIERQLGDTFRADVVAESGIADLLVLAADSTPRTIVRRINALLIDSQFHSQVDLPAELRDEEPPYTTFMGLCLVQRTLEDVLGAQTTRELATRDNLCRLIKEQGIGGAHSWLARAKETRGRGYAKPQQPKSSSQETVPDEFEQRTWMALVNELIARDTLNAVLKHPLGQHWLESGAARRAVGELVARRSESVPLVSASQPEQNDGFQPIAGLPREQAEAIKQAVYRARGSIYNVLDPLPPSRSAFASITEIDFGDYQLLARLADDGLEWLASGSVPLTNLRELKLNATYITDRGIAALARKDTPLKHLRRLELAETKITDGSLAALSSAVSGLRSLVWLELDATGITDSGVTLVADPSSALKRLQTLSLHATNITDVSVKAMAADSSLKELHCLWVSRTKISDVGLEAIAAERSALANLDQLFLDGTGVTDAGIAAIAAKKSKLQRLTNLSISNTAVTDQGFGLIASPSSGLRALTDLSLGSTKISDKGLMHVAASDAALPNLAYLNLSGTPTTVRAREKLIAARPGLQIKCDD